MVDIDEAGLPKAARAEARFERPVGDVWKVIDDVDRYADRVPMMHKVRRSGDRANREERDLELETLLEAMRAAVEKS